MNKKGFKQRSFALLVFSCFAIAGLISCDSNPDTGKSYKTVNASIYVPEYNRYTEDYEAVNSGVSINLKFFDNVKDLPYVSVKDYIDTFISSSIYSVTYSKGNYTITNNIWKNRSSSYKPCATFNIKNNTLTYDDYACFININSYAANPVDLVCGNDPDLVVSGYSLFGNISDSYYQAGDQITINLKDTYNIQAYVEGGTLYMPLYTVKSLFTSNYISSYFYNGNNLFYNIPNTADYTTYVSKVKNNIFTPTSGYLEYAYNQMALDLDLHYGMGGIKRKMRYNNNEFEYTFGLPGKSYSVLNNYKSQFLSSAASFDTTSETLFADILDDGGHTGLFANSYFSSYKDMDIGEETEFCGESGSKIASQRSDKTKYPVGKSYAKISSDEKTMILRLENFDDDGLTWVIAVCENMVDTYTNVNKLIIDLSCNGGGYIFLQHYINQYLSRGNSKNYFVNSINGSKGYVQYPANVYLDNKIDSKDKLPTDRGTFTVELICSNYTFSAANATACYAATSNPSDVTLHICGENSGGGVCAVDSTMMNAFGMCAQFSSPYRITYSDFATNVDDGIASKASFYISWNSHTDDGAKEFSKYYLGS